MSPEQCAGETTVDARSDLYSLGVMGYELLGGSTPFPGATPQQVLAAHLTRTPPPISSVRPDLPPAFAQAIMRCLEKNPGDRWASADALMAAIDPFTSSS